MKYELTCINCPMGCRITAEYDGKDVTNIDGYTCARGKAYAKAEIIDPTRMVTALVRIEGRQSPLSVKTRGPIRKVLVFSALEAISKTTVKAPIHIGDVIIKNICDSGVDVVATENIG